jgi:hypothetical protein
VYQYAYLDYYEPMEQYEVDEYTNVDVFEEIEENYPRKFWFSKGTNECVG